MKRLALAVALLLPTAWVGAAPDSSAAAGGGDEEMMTSAATKPATRSLEVPTSGPGAQMLRALRDNAAKLNLTEDQRVRLAEVANQAREKARQIIEEANGDREKVRPRLQALTRDIFEKVRAVMTPEQREKFRRMMSDRPMAARRPGEGEMRENIDTKEVKKKESAAAAPVAKREPVDYRQLELKRAGDGKVIKLSTFKGKPTVLVFGSYTCPNFRSNAKELDDLAKKFALKANFVTIYTKEAHPSGGWEVERNKDAEISMPQHKDIDERVKAALQAKGKLGLMTTTLVDTMDDQAIRAFDEVFPNGAVVLDKDGNVAGTQRWAEARGLRSVLDQLTGAKPTAKVSADD